MREPPFTHATTATMNQNAAPQMSTWVTSAVPDVASEARTYVVALRSIAWGRDLLRQALYRRLLGLLARVERAFCSWWREWFM